MTLIRYSVVIPIKNESENLPLLIQELVPILQRLDGASEIICVDDGSTDGSFSVLMHQQQTVPHLRLISFDKNYGQTSAFDAGFKAARGEWIITLDADLQNDPADIPALIKLSDSHDLVCGLRLDRQDSLIKKATSKLANFLRMRMLKDNIPDTGCSLKLYRAECLRQITLYHGMHRFFPALFKIHGFRITSVPVKHRYRQKGKSNYNFFNRLLGPIIDLWVVHWMAKRYLRYKIKETHGH